MAARVGVPSRWQHWALALLLLPGCASNIPYPSSWSTLPAGDVADCRRLAGEYRDAGESADSTDPWTPSLSSLLGQVRTARQPTRVTLSLPQDDRLEARSWAEGTLLSTRTFGPVKGHGLCEAGRTIVRADHTITGAGASGYTWATITLSADEHHLMAQVKTTEFGLIFIVPVWATMTRWYRFARLP